MSQIGVFLSYLFDEVLFYIFYRWLLWHQIWFLFINVFLKCFKCLCMEPTAVESFTFSAVVHVWCVSLCRKFLPTIVALNQIYVVFLVWKYKKLLIELFKLFLVVFSITSRRKKFSTNWALVLSLIHHLVVTVSVHLVFAIQEHPIVFGFWQVSETHHTTLCFDAIVRL